MKRQIQYFSHKRQVSEAVTTQHVTRVQELTILGPASFINNPPATNLIKSIQNKKQNWWDSVADELRVVQDTSFLVLTPLSVGGIYWLTPNPQSTATVTGCSQSLCRRPWWQSYQGKSKLLSRNTRPKENHMKRNWICQQLCELEANVSPFGPQMRPQPWLTPLRCSLAEDEAKLCLSSWPTDTGR